MDFFERQDKARRNTKLLVFYFVLAVLSIIAAVYLAAALLFQGAAATQREAPPEFALWRPELLLWVTTGTLGVIVCGSVFKTMQLAAGGSAVAESLGGRLLSPNTSEPDERKLLNVVEEMALASGVAVPKVYVMDREMGINAFAAGHSPNDAAIGVTRGCMQLLKRDELQGVIAHEFSHILNGDMRLNLRLMGILFGIFCLTVIGRILLYARGSSRDRNPLPILGLVLILIGWVGVFFGRLIQAAVSRQREYLADAAAVQFTRNPGGLSGALQRIGGLAYGSRLESPHAEEASHMFFGSAMRSSFTSAFATHPPLEKRIRAIDPGWDGKFARAGAASAKAEQPPPRAGAKPPVIPFPFPPIPGMPRGQASVAGLAGPVIQAQTVMPSLGQPTPLHLRYAEELRASFPATVQAATREPLSAVALVYALLLSTDENLRAAQLKEVASQAGTTIQQQTADLFSEVAPVAARARLPLVDLAIPALRQLRPEEYRDFRRTLKWLVESDRQIDLFEFILQKVIRRHLDPQFEKTRPPVIQFHSLRPLLPDCALLLSALAQIGHSQDPEVQHAFRAGVPYLRSPNGEVALLPRAQCGLAPIDVALNRLAQAAPQIKKYLLDACVHVVGADGVIQEREAELLRAIADTLDCPIPPFLTAA